jgi:NAD(P)H dehydrogenase (quinone)
VVADFLDLDGVTNAVQGVDGAYFCYPVRPGLVEATATFAQAATDAGVRSVVNMSQVPARRDGRSSASRAHWLSERLLDRTGLLTTHLRPTFFAEWLMLWWEVRDGEGFLRLPFGTGRHAPIAVADQWPVIAAVLIEPEPHDHAIYPLYGPAELNYDEIADEMASVLGFPVRYEQVTVGEFAAAMAGHGLPAYLVQHLSNVAVDYQRGIFAGSNDLVAKIGGAEPLTVGQFVEHHRPRFDASGPLFVPGA